MRKMGTEVQTVCVSVETGFFPPSFSKNNLYCNLETKVMTHQKRDGWSGGGEELGVGGWEWGSKPGLESSDRNLAEF